ncbi:substrate-binding domain-containing protein [Paraburkholderia sp. LEh10]|uniref:molybdate ABC transporter substrate-binding protein n=1 Tax=Paraburkholderia sp. LEh10 TaxID=2821353 RepID=UPI001AE542FA|nr:substrate-binding domain-containing protein [Paraburkholderia sp. LEh10]MBP0595941.1 substrate-binding domain-containing protein [Paraburkholderia sp. LEh10]
MKIRVMESICLVVLLVLTRAGLAWAEELKVLSTPTLKSTLEEMTPTVEQQTGCHLVTRFDNAATLKQQIEAGEAFDVAILLPEQVDDLIAHGSIAAGSRTDVAKAMVGMATRAEVPAPDISTVDAFRQALLNAQTLSWSPGSASGAYLVSLLDRLGIAETVKPRLVPVSGGRVVEAVANGTADATVITVPNIVDAPGVKLAGILPRELQHYTVYTAGVSVRTVNAEASQAIIRLLMEPRTTAMLQKKGLERASP